LLRERCASRRDVGASSFTGVGRGGLPPSPDTPLTTGYLDGAGVAAAIPVGASEASAGGSSGLAPPCAPRL